MAVKNKIDASETSLAFALEACIGELPGEGTNPGSPDWISAKPNSYGDFGTTYTNTAPTPIVDDRQREVGVQTDAEGVAGWNENLNFHASQPLMTNFMFADIRKKGQQFVSAVDVTGDPDEYDISSTAGFLVNSLVKGLGFTNSANNGLHVVTAVTADTSIGVTDGSLVAEASPPSNAKVDVVGYEFGAGELSVDTTGDYVTLTSSGVDLTTLGLVDGQFIFLGGDTALSQFATAANNGLKRIRNVVDATTMIIDKSDIAMVTEVAGAQEIQMFFGDVLKNEKAGTISSKSHQIERTLGEDANGTQSQVMIGCVGSEFTLNATQDDLVNTDLAFVSIGEQLRDGTAGPKQSGVSTPYAAKAYSNGSDLNGLRMFVASSSEEFVTPLFAFVTEATISINNNLTVNKALGSISGFDVSAGTFTVSGSLTAYFSTIAALEAIKNNSNVSFDISYFKDNLGLVMDIPLVSLGDGRLNVEIDTPITIPLSMEAASARDLYEGHDFTFMITYFNYLPTAA